MLTLHDLLRIYGEAGLDLGQVRPIALSEVCIDSRLCRPGSLFVALPGEHHNGHDYMEHALQQGCRCVLARSDRIPSPQPQSLPVQTYIWDGQAWTHGGPTEAEAALVLVPQPLQALQRLAAVWRARFSPTVVGITGSVGKSTTKELVAAVLGQRYVTLKSPKSYNNEIGLPLTLLQLQPEHQAVVLEMGTYGPGEISELVRIARPQVGVVTNVSHSHLERMGRLEVIQQAKGELPAALPPDGLAVLNGDEELIRQMAQNTAAPVLFYGLGEGCDLRASHVRSRGLDGVSFQVAFGDEHRSLHCSLPGRHSVSNALAAVAVGRHLGLTWEEIGAGLQAPGAPLRLQPVPAVGGALLLDDTYNASPVSCRAALDLLAELPGRRIAVLGDMLELGSYEEEAHRQVGRWAAEVVEELIVLGPRARWMGQAALAAPSPPQVRFAESGDEVVDLLAGRLQEGDVLLVKGSRALEMERIVAALRAGTEVDSLAGGAQPQEA